MVSNGFKVLVPQRLRNCFVITKQLRCIYFMRIACAYCMHRFDAYGTVHDKFAKHAIHLTHPEELLTHNCHYTGVRCLHLAFPQTQHHVILGNTQNRKPIATTKIINVHKTSPSIIWSIDVIQKANGWKYVHRLQLREMNALETSRTQFKHNTAQLIAQHNYNYKFAKQPKWYGI